MEKSMKDSSTEPTVIQKFYWQYANRMRRPKLRYTRRQQSKWHQSWSLKLSMRRLGWAHQHRAAKRRRRADVVKVNEGRGRMRPRKLGRSQPARHNE
eukprot:3033992-Pleurochrysis_carterae.AAC.1